jgi:hypothetical protein
MKILLVGVELFHERTDMTNLIAAFPNFANALKIKLLMLCREIIALCSDIHKKNT